MTECEHPVTYLRSMKCQGDYGSYKSIIEFQVNFCVWKMKRWVITMSKVVVEIIWDNAVWIVFSRCHFLYKCELSVDVWNVFLVFHLPHALRQWCSTLAVYYNHLQYLKSVNIYVSPREVLINSSLVKPGPWHIGYSRVNAHQLFLLLLLFSFWSWYRTIISLMTKCLSPKMS